MLARWWNQLITLVYWTAIWVKGSFLRMVLAVSADNCYEMTIKPLRDGDRKFLERPPSLY